ncbi:hypothetical protein IWZ03DRAFT_22800 [Phyllosticta citriasiana]|uniref:Secreted peptide n=1 Tax=Phyllosticta citriasiana TaxID=595635 RepID=A0ABR1L1N0_9PEZI
MLASASLAVGAWRLHVFLVGLAADWLVSVRLRASLCSFFFSSLLFSRRTDGLIPHTHTHTHTHTHYCVCLSRVRYPAAVHTHTSLFRLSTLLLLLLLPLLGVNWLATDGRTDGRRNHACMGWRLA